MSYNAVTPSEVIYQAPITSQVFVKTRDNLDHIKSALSDGASASQGINTSTLTTSGNVLIGDDLYPNGGNVIGEHQDFNLIGATEFKENTSSMGYLTNASGVNFADSSADGTDWNAITLAIMFGKTNSWIERGCF